MDQGQTLMRRPAARSAWKLCTVGIALLALGACIVVPTPEHGLLSGYVRITESSLDDLEIGKTTREQVLLRFGLPTKSFQRERILVYHWSVISGYWFAASEANAGYGKFDRHHEVAFQFDGSGLLQNFVHKVVHGPLRNDPRLEGYEILEIRDFGIGSGTGFSLAKLSKLFVDHLYERIRKERSRNVNGSLFREVVRHTDQVKSVLVMTGEVYTWGSGMQRTVSVAIDFTDKESGKKILSTTLSRESNIFSPATWVTKKLVESLMEKVAGFNTYTLE